MRMFLREVWLAVGVVKVLAGHDQVSEDILADPVDKGHKQVITCI